MKVYTDSGIYSFESFEGTLKCSTGSKNYVVLLMNNIEAGKIMKLLVRELNDDDNNTNKCFVLKALVENIKS